MVSITLLQALSNHQKKLLYDVWSGQIVPPIGEAWRDAKNAVRHIERNDAPFLRCPQFRRSKGLEKSSFCRLPECQEKTPDSTMISDLLHVPSGLYLPAVLRLLAGVLTVEKKEKTRWRS
jgi:hypothetical protein